MDTATEANSTRPPAFSAILLALAGLIIFGATRSDAQVAEVVVADAGEPSLQSGASVDELEAIIAEQELQIAVLQEQVAIARQATLQSEDRVDSQRETIVKFQQSDGKNRFEELTGLVFEDWIRDPLLNGYMAAVVEDEHSSGLNAWTCWRKRR